MLFGPLPQQGPALPTPALVALCLLGLAAGVILVVFAASLRVVPEYGRLAIFRLGRFAGVRGPGLVFLVPFTDRGVVVDLREQVQEVEGGAVATRDNARVAVDLVWRYRIVDPARSLLSVGDLEAAAHDMAATALAAVVRGMSFDDLWLSREALKSRLHTLLSEGAEPWGLEVTSVDVRNIARS